MTPKESPGRLPLGGAGPGRRGPASVAALFGVSQALLFRCPVGVACAVGQRRGVEVRGTVGAARGAVSGRTSRWCDMRVLVVAVALSLSKEDCCKRSSAAIPIREAQMTGPDAMRS
jgi:hypothetical protein